MTREEAARILKPLAKYVDLSTYEKEAINMAIEALSHERPKGRWKRCKYSHKLGECSLCGEIVEIRSKYCPNCGADMRGGRNEV